MANTVSRTSDSLAVMGAEINAAAVDNTTQDSPWVSLGTAHKVVFVIVVKDTNAAADTTIDAQVRSADDGSGTNPANVTGLATTQITAANASDKILVLEVNSDEVQGINAGDTHVGVRVTAGNGTGGANICIVCLSDALNYEPASNYDSSEVQQVKTL